MTTTRVPDSFCTRCNNKLTAASDFDGDPEPPTPGCFTFCLYCGHIMMFNKGLRLRDLTPMEQEEFDHSVDLQRMAQFMARNARGRNN